MPVRFARRGRPRRAQALPWKACAAILSVAAMHFGAAAPRTMAPVPTISIDYPADQSLVPPEITPPTFVWRDPVRTAQVWKIDIAFGDGSAPIHATSRGERMQIGRID